MNRNNIIKRQIIPFHPRSFIQDPFTFLRQEIDHLFEKSSSLEGISPKIEVKENGNMMEITAELPGISEEDIHISLSNGLLTIEGQKKAEERQEGETYYIEEIQYGRFSRSLKLPYEPAEKDVNASFKDGVLKVAVLKPQKLKEGSYRIPIQKI